MCGNGMSSVVLRACMLSVVACCLCVRLCCSLCVCVCVCEDPPPVSKTTTSAVSSVLRSQVVYCILAHVVSGIQVQVPWKPVEQSIAHPMEEELLTSASPGLQSQTKLASSRGKRRHWTRGCSSGNRRRRQCVAISPR